MKMRRLEAAFIVGTLLLTTIATTGFLKIPLLPSVSAQPGVEEYGNATTEIVYGQSYDSGSIKINTSKFTNSSGGSPYGAHTYRLFYPVYQKYNSNAFFMYWEPFYVSGSPVEVDQIKNSTTLDTGGAAIIFNRSGMWIFDNNAVHSASDPSSFSGYIWVNTSCCYTINSIPDIFNNETGYLSVTVDTKGDTGCMIAITNPSNQTIYHSWRSTGQTGYLDYHQYFSALGKYTVKAYRDLDTSVSYRYIDQNGENYSDSYGSIGAPNFPANYSYSAVGPWNPPERNASIITFEHKTDYTPPEIVDHTPSIGYAGDTFIFNVTINDENNVSVAWIEQWYGTGGHGQIDLMNIADNIWTATITIEPSLDTMHYCITAADMAYNWNTTATMNVTIFDIECPTFIDYSSLNGTTGDPYFFNIVAHDNVAIASVTVTWTHGGYGGTDVPLTDGGGIWGLWIILDNNLSSMLYTITVRDTSNNTNIGPQKAVSVFDNDPPIIINHSPSVAHAGDSFTINVTVTDNILLASVWVEYWLDDGVHCNSTMTFYGSDIWSKTVPVNLTSVILRYIVSAFDSSGNEADTGVITVPVGPDYPPNTPSIPSGPHSDHHGVECTYTTNTTDVDGDQVYYMFDWGDGTASEWIGPFNSGANGSASHTWAKGSYQVKVKAKDVHGVESDWSPSLPISMPYKRDRGFLQFLNLLFERFLNIFPLLRHLFGC